MTSKMNTSSKSLAKKEPSEEEKSLEWRELTIPEKRKLGTWRWDFAISSSDHCFSPPAQWRWSPWPAWCWWPATPGSTAWPSPSPSLQTRTSALACQLWIPECKTVYVICWKEFLWIKTFILVNSICDVVNICTQVFQKWSSWSYWMYLGVVISVWEW